MLQVQLIIVLCLCPLSPVIQHYKYCLTEMFQVQHIVFHVSHFPATELYHVLYFNI